MSKKEDKSDELSSLTTFSVFEYKNQRKFALFREKLVSYLTPFLKRTKITPNIITLIGVFFLLPYSYYFSINIKISILFLIPYLIFDGLDGAFARVTGNTSLGGALLDIVADHLGMVFSVLLIINSGLANPALSAYYGIVYIVMIAFTVCLNFMGQPIKFIIRSKIILFLGIFIYAYFDINFLNKLMLCFSIIMTLTSIVTFLKLMKLLNKR